MYVMTGAQISSLEGLVKSWSAFEVAAGEFASIGIVGSCR